MKLAKNFRDTARAALRGKWAIALIATLIASFLGGTLFDFNFEITFNSGEMTEEGITNDPAILDEMFGLLLLALPSIILSLVISLVLGSIIKIGHAKFYLSVIDGAPPSIGILFSEFRRWSAAVVSELLKFIIILLGALFFIIPGIVAFYSYSMTPYIIAETENISAKEALRTSKEMMRGNRFRLFCLHFSFIGWEILSVLSLGIGFLWLNPYINAATTDFYRDVSGTASIPYLRVDEPIEDESDTSNDSDDWFYGNQ